MNELDSLRQEAETLKNAIRVSKLTEWRWSDGNNLQPTPSLIFFRMPESRRVTRALCRRRIKWSLSGASRCERDARCAAIWPRSTRCTGEVTRETWCRPARTASWLSGTRTQLTRCTRSRYARPGSWLVPMRRPAVLSRAAAWTTFVRFTVSKTARATCACPANCPAILVTCPAVGSLTIIK